MVEKTKRFGRFSGKDGKGLRAAIFDFVNGLRRMDSNMDGTPDDIRGSVDTEAGYTSPEAAYYREQMKGLLDTSRQARIRDFRQMEEDYSRVATALTVHSDTATMSEEGDTVAVTIESEDEDLKNIWHDLQNRTNFLNQLWSVSREGRHVGDAFYEIIINDFGLIVRLKRLSPETIIVCDDGKGGLASPAYKQINPITQETIAEFEWWEMAHLKNDPVGNLTYGKSLLHSARRVYKHLQMMEEAMVIKRMTRATDKLAFLVEGGKMSDQRAKNYIRMLKDFNKRTKVFDPTTGEISRRYNPIGANEDFYILTREGRGDVKVLAGPQGSMDISDIKYIQLDFLASLNTPLAYLALEENTSSKNVIGDEGVQWSKSIRRLQSNLSSWCRFIFNLQYALLFGKFLPNSEYQLIFPPISARDEEIRWNIERIKAEIARIYKVEAGAVENIWIYTELMGMSKEEALKYDAIVQGYELEDEEGPASEMNRKLMLPSVQEVRRNRWLMGSIGDLEKAVKEAGQKNKL